LIQRRILARLKTIFFRILHIRRSFRVSFDVSIKLPPGHQLPEYREVYPKYDTFLGKLATILPPGTAVIDIGANVGDSLAMLISQNSQLNYLCIEPDLLFFKYLSSNRERLIQKFPSTRVELRKTFVGTSKSGYLEGGSTTKHFIASTGSSNQEFRTLSGITEEAFELFDSKAISLIKIDVDGYDWDVIESGMDVIQDVRPFLFFEAQVLDLAGINGTIKAVEELSKLEYVFVMFDNFGNYATTTTDVDAVSKLIKYSFHVGGNQSPIDYFDILCVQKTQVQNIEKIL